MGGNGRINWEADFSGTMALVKTFADTLHEEYPNCKLKLMNMQLPSMELMMPGYGAKGVRYADTYGILVTLLRLGEAYQDFAKQSGYSDWVEYINLACQFDSDNNLVLTQKNVNTRNSSIQEPFCGNTLHPGYTTGYYQYADAVYRNFVANFCQS